MTTIDYAKVVERIEQSVRANRFLLIEALAEHIAQLVMNEFGAPWVKVSAAKVGILPNAKFVGVTLERRRPT